MSDLPSFLTRTGPSAYTLTFSASAAETFMLCPAKYSWSRVTGIESATARAGMNYGKATHLALAHRYGNMQASLAQIEEAAAGIMAAYFAEHPQPELGTKGRAEWRTLARAMQAFRAYNAAYPAEDFEVLGVEEPFEVELGKFETGGNALALTPLATVTVKFRGIRDLRVRWHDAIWVLDHKTSGEWSDLTVDEGRASFQFQGYGWVERLFAATYFCKGCGNAIDPETCHCGDYVKSHGIESGHSPIPMGCTCGYADQSQFPQGPFTPPAVGGVIGNYLIARKPYEENFALDALARSLASGEAPPARKPRKNDLPRDQFERQAYPYSDAQLDEWHARAMGIAKGIWQRWSESDWPQHSTACAHWGRCEYYRLCWETDPAYRMAAAMGADYRARTPSPFEDTENAKERA